MSGLKYLELNNKVKQVMDDGFFDLDSDLLAVKEFSVYISTQTKSFDSYEQKLNYLIDESYYIDFLKMYDIDVINEIHEYVLSFNFKFQSFMAIQKFYETYALKSFDKKYFLESYEDRIVATALFIGNGNFKFAKKLAKTMITQQYQPATPTFLNSGKLKSGELVSCFLLEMDDSLNSINYNLSTSMQLSKIGGGVAINLSKLRARTEDIKGNTGVARGVVPVMKLLEDAFSYVDQLGQRPGAGAVYLNIFHADVLEFLDTKKINSDEKSRIQTLSLGLIVPNMFLKLAKQNKMMSLFYPHTVFSEYGISLDDMDLDDMYETLCANDKVRKKEISPRDLLQQIALTQFESGYPYLVYVDNAQEQNPLKKFGKVKMSNLCTEIFQVQTTSKIKDYGEDDEIGYDISCNLGSLNIVNVMENKNLEDAVFNATKALSRVSDLSQIKNAPGVKKANNDFHSIGLGVMNLHGYFTKNNISYESEEAKEFASAFFSAMNFYSLTASNKIAHKRREKFVGFEQSEYNSGKYFDKYLTNDFSPKSEKIIKLFEGINLPTKQDWLELKSEVHKYGLYNAYRLAIAPTQSISYIQNSTASIQPVVNTIETRMYGNMLTYYPMPYLTKKNVLYYKSAYNMDQMKIIDLVSVIQPHIDQGISTVLYVTNQCTTAQLAKFYVYAWNKGLKSLYYIRTKNLTIEECETCSV